MVPAVALKGVFTRDPRSQRRYSGPHLDNLLLCFRFFKALRNAIAHNGGRVSEEVLKSYLRFRPIATPAALGRQEVPAHSQITKVDEPIRLNLRGVIGLSDVILQIVTTYDMDFGETHLAAREVAIRIKSTSLANQNMIPHTDRREKRILARVRAANLPSARLTTEFEAFLKSEGIIPGYA